ncbi:MAG: FAD-binding domain-containing protein [Candidatus Sericytochromatia bacterium]
MGYKKYQQGIWWIKRDLRLLDNPALHAVLTQCERVLPVYVLEPEWLAADDCSAQHVDAVFQALEDLRDRLAQRGAPLLILQGSLPAVWQDLHARWPFAALFSHQETGVSWTRSRDLQVRDWCRRHRVDWHEPAQNGVFRDLTDRDTRDARWQEWASQPLLPLPKTLAAPDAAELAALGLKSQWSSLPELGLTPPSHPDVQRVSERMAQRTLQTFLTERGAAYLDGTASSNTAFQAGSRLSVHLAWGTISPRQVWQQTEAALREHQAPGHDAWRHSLQAFGSRLHWRDHFIQRLESEPEMEFRALHPAYRNLSWESEQRERYLQAWLAGQAGYPLVDASMRCLQATGFVNFQMRALLVSFACHVLQLDWRVIHPHLARLFRDYEPGIHLSQLQMQAGVVGINTLRVYSPLRQLMLQDPELVFVRRWVPELTGATVDDVARKRLHRWAYPRPLVDFATRAADTQARIYALSKQYRDSILTKEVVKRHGARRRRRGDQRAVFPRVEQGAGFG